jgi:hypothetical protein
MYEAFPDQVSIWRDHTQPALARQTRNDVNGSDPLLESRGSSLHNVGEPL